MSRLDSPDKFLGGKLSLRQGGYRAGADPVFLAAAVPAAPGQSLLDLGTGAGVALFCVASRVSGLQLCGLERNAAQAALARQNAEANGLAAEIVEGCVSAVPLALRERSFDHVIMNPPFFASGSQSPDDDRRQGRHEDVALPIWLDAGIRRLKPGGQLTLIQKADRLAEVCFGIGDRLGDIDIRPMAPRKGRDAKLVILSGVKGAKGPLRLRPPFILHEGDSHQRDGDSYTEAASNILRQGAKFPD